MSPKKKLPTNKELQLYQKQLNKVSGQLRVLSLTDEENVLELKDFCKKKAVENTVIYLDNLIRLFQFRQKFKIVSKNYKFAFPDSIIDIIIKFHDNKYVNERALFSYFELNRVDRYYSILSSIEKKVFLPVKYSYCNYIFSYNRCSCNRCKYIRLNKYLDHEENYPDYSDNDISGLPQFKNKNRKKKKNITIQIN